MNIGTPFSENYSSKIVHPDTGSFQKKIGSSSVLQRKLPVLSYRLFKIFLAVLVDFFVYCVIYSVKGTARAAHGQRRDQITCSG